MTPNIQFVTIGDNKKQILEFIDDIIITPKATLKKWSAITNQTPAVKLGYIGQHLASLITGVKGTGSGARGDDLEDGSEVKSCNKIDQADKCKNCGRRVMRYDEVCPYCNSSAIERKDDSKWLFSVRSKEELQQYLNMDRVVLVLMDYPNFANNDFNDVRISVFEIYPKENRMKVFGELIQNHYQNIYLPKLNDNAKTNPMNLHPFSFQFYKCNPIKTFECIIKNIETAPKVSVNKYIQPKTDRNSSIKSEDMPSELLKEPEWNALINNAPYSKLKKIMTKNISKIELEKMTNKEKVQTIPYITEQFKGFIPLRPINSVRQQAHYQRS